MDVERLDDLRELIGEYWHLAFAEGQEGRSTDTPDGAAQKCISAIEAIIREARAVLTPPEGYVLVPVETQKDAERFQWLKKCSREQYLLARGMFGLADDVIDAVIRDEAKEESNGK